MIQTGSRGVQGGEKITHQLQDACKDVTLVWQESREVKEMDGRKQQEGGGGGGGQEQAVQENEAEWVGVSGNIDETMEKGNS